MKTAKDEFDALFDRMKNSIMDWYFVDRKVEPNWLPHGTVPFDVSVKKGIATFRVYASSQDNAEEQVNRYLEQDEHED